LLLCSEIFVCRAPLHCRKHALIPARAELGWAQQGTFVLHVCWGGIVPQDRGSSTKSCEVGWHLKGVGPRTFAGRTPRNLQCIWPRRFSGTFPCGQVWPLDRRPFEVHPVTSLTNSNSNISSLRTADLGPTRLLCRIPTQHVCQHPYRVKLCWGGISGVPSAEFHRVFADPTTISKYANI